MKELKLLSSQNNQTNKHLQDPFTLSELNNALKTLKSGKAPGPGGIHNEFLAHPGNKLKNWLLQFLNLSFSTHSIPKIWRRAKVVAILKPGKDPNLLQSYCPISLLCSSYKLMERMILSRINPIVDPLLPGEQAGFRSGKSTCDQVAKLTQDIERAFQNMQVCGAVFLDLTSTYDTVWHKGLHLKLLKSIRCKQMTDFIMELLCNRSFVLCTSDGQTSKPHRMKYGEAQGLVLAPMLYNHYTADFPATTSTKYMYADDVALMAATSTFKQADTTLRQDMAVIQTFLRSWRLKLSTNKTVSSTFHLKNHRANYRPKIYLNNQQLLRTEANPKYLGVSLDRTLIFKHHLDHLKRKVSSRVALIKRLPNPTYFSAGTCLCPCRVLCSCLEPQHTFPQD